jgi:hypothetical protein
MHVLTPHPISQLAAALAGGIVLGLAGVMAQAVALVMLLALWGKVAGGRAPLRFVRGAAIPALLLVLIYGYATGGVTLGQQGWTPTVDGMRQGATMALLLAVLAANSLVLLGRVPPQAWGTGFGLVGQTLAAVAHMPVLYQQARGRTPLHRLRALVGHLLTAPEADLVAAASPPAARAGVGISVAWWGVPLLLAALTALDSGAAGS